MARIISVILCLLFMNSVYAQDRIAKTADGQIIILKKDGTWSVKDNTELRDNKATTEDGQLVLLARNGKWFSTNVTVASPSARQESNQSAEKSYSSSTGTSTIAYSSATVSGTACVHVPAAAKGGSSESRPLMMLLDPTGNANGIVARWKRAADHLGWIIASTPSIMNRTPADQDLEHLLALLDAISSKWSVDTRATILGGFSGGACGAYRHALERPDLFRGAIVECGHMGPFRDMRDRIRPGLLFYLATRTQDFNAPATRALAAEFEARGETVKLIELPGGHEPLTGADVDGALEWMDSLLR